MITDTSAHAMQQVESRRRRETSLTHAGLRPARAISAHLSYAIRHTLEQQEMDSEGFGDASVIGVGDAERSVSETADRSVLTRRQLQL